jgi:hypothetical protein
MFDENKQSNKNAVGHLRWELWCPAVLINLVIKLYLTDLCFRIIS